MKEYLKIVLLALISFVVIVSLGKLIIKSDFSPPAQTSTTAVSPTPGILPGLQASNTPWKAEIDHLKERSLAINLPLLTGEGSALHIHQHLDLYINSKKFVPPTDIGVDEVNKLISPLHTHDDSGIIHVESNVVADFTLGQFFDVWGVRFTQECVGGYCNDSTQKLSLFIDGKPYTGVYRDLILSPRQEIALIYGTEQEIPSPIPSTYVFPKDY